MNREQIRQSVWSQLIHVARPDSRFHLDFHEYIPDFEGNEAATERALALPEYQSAQVIFITPDNGLERLRAQAVRDGKTMLVTTYGIRRGFIELLPAMVPPGLEDYAVLLDALERFGQPISLAEIRAKYHFDFLVTGASAVSADGVRFGKGHGFFDLEWAMLTDIGAVDVSTPVAAVVHDCQYVEMDLNPGPHDTLCDLVVTPTRTIRIPNPRKSDTGVLWDKLAPGMLDSIPPLRELQTLVSRAP